MKVPLVDLVAQNASIRAPLEEAATRVLRSGTYCLGPEVEAFEDEFARYCGAPHAVAVNSGTSALHLALLACGIGEGDEVITSTFTFVATVAAIRYAGARPVLVDVEPLSWTIDPEAVRAAITPRTKAILPVHLHGRPADMSALWAIAQEHGLRIIEDASQAHGALHQGQRVGGIGDVGTFSFYPAKPLGALGEGGALVTRSSEIAERARVLRHWGQAGHNRHDVAGFNMRMDAVQAAMLRVKLPHVDRWSAARAGHARSYRERLAGTDISYPAVHPGCSEVHHVFAIEVADRDRLGAQLLEAGIATGIHYPRPVHLQPAYADLGYPRGSFPVAERKAARTLSLPLFAELTEQQIDHVCRAAGQAVRESDSERRHPAGVIRSELHPNVARPELALPQNGLALVPAAPSGTKAAPSAGAGGRDMQSSA